MSKNKYVLNIGFITPISFLSDIYDDEHVVHTPRECNKLLNKIAIILGDNDYVLENTFYKIKNDLIYGIKIQILELDVEQSNEIEKYIQEFNFKESNYTVKLVLINITKLQIIGWSPSYIKTDTSICISVPEYIKDIMKKATEILSNYNIDSELSIRDIKEKRDIDPEIILTIVTISKEYKIDIDTINEINSDFDKLTNNEIIIKLS